MRLTSILCVILGLVSLSEQAPKTVTLEDVRDALLHVVNLIRQSEDKLERHEFRERQLGEQVKKSLVILDKRLKTMEPLRGTVMRLDERIATIETILIKKNEKEDENLQKTIKTVEDIQKNLPVVIENVKNDILKKLEDVQKSATTTPKIPTNVNDINKNDLKTLKDDLKRETDELKTSIRNLSNEFNLMKDESYKFNEINEKSSDNLMEKVKRQLSESEHLLGKYENKLAEMSNKIPSSLSMALPNFKEQKEMQNNVLQALEKQKTKVDEMLANINDVSHKIDNVPHQISKNISNNNNSRIVEEFKQELTNESVKTLNLIDEKLHQIHYQNNDNHKKLMNTIDDIKASEMLLQKTMESDFANVKKEIKDLGRFEEVLLQSANGVLDTKRRIEYGVHQIILEMEESLKNHVKELNTSISDRFDNFEMTILDEENGALTNLTSKIGEEIDQVWRQIGIMHQQMTLNADTLNKLQNHTDIYVNGSLNVMDRMTGKVGQITGKMVEVDDNLNYLLGRLSLITQEFNMIKTGLGKALDQIKSSFMEVQNKINDGNSSKARAIDNGPGPHSISNQSNEVV